MKRILYVILTLVLMSVATTAGAGGPKRYVLGFYNVENLFDTYHDDGKNDYEFLPDGKNKWTEPKYEKKLHNIATVIRAMADENKAYHAVLGLSEVENAHCLADLVNQPSLKPRGYEFAHIEGPDKRGVDCALLYNPQLYKVRNVKLVPYIPELKKDSNYCTRGFLTVSGELAGEHLSVIVCHWPSRFATSFYRESAGRQVKAIKDSLQKEDPDCKVIVMGDMNDDPTNKSMTEMLCAKGDIKDVGAGDMYNPWYNLLVKKGTGTLQYNGAWNLFDQIVFTPNMINKDGGRDFSTLKFWKPQIFRRDYLFQTEGKYKGNTKRTTAGGVWLDGYSDHLPVVAYFAKEIK